MANALSGFTRAPRTGPLYLYLYLYHAYILLCVRRGPSGPAWSLGQRLTDPDPDTAGLGPGEYYSPGSPSGPAYTMGAKFKSRWGATGCAYQCTARPGHRRGRDN